MIEVGYFSFLFATLLSIYAIFTGLYCLWKRNNQSGLEHILASSRNAIVGVFLCVLLSSVILWNAIFIHDFSVQYVYMHSALDTPPIYLFTSFWSALEGSHLLWTFLLSLVCAISICTVRKKNLVYMPTLCVCFAAALFFMLLLNITISAPLTRLFPVGKFGLGMNALLQNPYMAIHPPMLFTGYSLLIVPFAYGAAALISGYFTHEWIITVRRASLIAWAFLTVAIFLGGKWAYYELGWGGYWGWDPVENSSFMPWLSLTASMHTLLIYSKTKRLPRLALFLIMLAFALSFQGTFITRSGVISSVHSFAESNIGPAYLAWILFLIISTIVLIFTRGYLLEGAAKVNEWRLSKETTLLFTIFFFLFLLALVFTGTILPLIIEAINGIKISIQQPFFNAFAPWLGLGFVSILGVGNLMRWKSGKIPSPLMCLGLPAVCSLLLTVFLHFQQNLNLIVTFAYFMVFWTAFILIMDLVYRLKNLHWNGLAFLRYRRSYLGSLIVHLGFLMAVLGFTGNYQTTSAEVNLNLHQSTHFHGYKLTNNGLSYNAEYNVQYVAADVEATNEFTQESVVIKPMRSKFTNNEQWFNEVGVYSTFWHDVYLVLGSFDVKTESISIKMNYNPTVKFVWTSLLVAVFGILIALSHRPPSSSEPQVNKPSLLNGISSAGIVAVTLVSLFFAYSGIAKAQTTPEPVPTQIDAKLLDVGKELRCPTCLGMSVIESETPQSVAMRAEISNQLAQGKSKEEIINYFKNRYGAWILRQPDFMSSYGFFIWIIPIVVLIAGPLFILFKVRKSQKNARNKV
ncbi:MAG: cytochrome c-type biogenesis CcmF C-terminal domain-containing protein [Bdellovibrionota bacterium]